MADIVKTRNFEGILYPENMLEDWKEQIDHKIQLPYAYCIHDKDLQKDTEESRKTHVHLIISFPNTTTLNHAKNVMMRLSAPGKKCVGCVESIVYIRESYDYLIHDTEAAKKAGKYQYDVKERIEGNNFDIGSLEQLSLSDKNKILKHMINLIYLGEYTNFADFNFMIMNNFESTYFEVLRQNVTYISQIIKGMYHKAESKRK